MISSADPILMKRRATASFRGQRDDVRFSKPPERVPDVKVSTRTSSVNPRPSRSA